MNLSYTFVFKYYSFLFFIHIFRVVIFSTTQVPLSDISDFFLTEVTSNLVSAANNSNHATKASNIGLSLSNPTTGVVSSSLSSANPNPAPSVYNEEMRFHGTELVMLYDYKVENKNPYCLNRDLI